MPAPDGGEGKANLLHLDRVASADDVSGLDPNMEDDSVGTTSRSQSPLQPNAEPIKIPRGSTPERRSQTEPCARTSTPSLNGVKYSSDAAQRPGLYAKSRESVIIDDSKSPGDADKPVDVIDEHNAEVTKILQAWTTTISRILEADIQALDIPIDEIQKLLNSRAGDEYSLTDALSGLNLFQRDLILNHVSRNEATLLFVDTWKEYVVTAYGELDILLLIWITIGPLRKADADTFLLQNPVDADDLKSNEVQEEEASNLPSQENGPPKSVKLKDAVGRNFTFPFELVKTWKGMQELISQAFHHVADIEAHVQQGRYDLMDVSTNDIILPQVWEHFVRPGLEVSMHLWPFPEAPRPNVARGAGVPVKLAEFEDLASTVPIRPPPPPPPNQPENIPRPPSPTLRFADGSRASALIDRFDTSESGEPDSDAYVRRKRARQRPLPALGLMKGKAKANPEGKSKRAAKDDKDGEAVVQQYLLKWTE